MVERTIPDKPRPAAPEGESTKAKYYRATKWLTVLIFRPLTGKSKETSLYLCALCGLEGAQRLGVR
jgi:hypothetical protein